MNDQDNADIDDEGQTLGNSGEINNQEESRLTLCNIHIKPAFREKCKICFVGCPLYEGIFT